MRRIRVLGAGLIVCSQAAGLAAQETRLGVHAGQTTDERGNSHAGLTIAPAVAWMNGESAARLYGHGTVFQGGGMLGVAGLSLTEGTALGNGLVLSLGLQGAVAGSDAGYRAASAALAPELRWQGQGWGVAAGPTLGIGGERSGVTTTPGGGLLPWSTGAEQREEMRWRQVTGARAAAWGASGPVQLRLGWSGARSEQADWQDWTAGLGIEQGALALGVEAGTRTGQWTESWASARAALQVAGPVALTAEVGSFPTDPVMRRAGGRYASLGVSLSGGSAVPRRRTEGPAPIRAADGRIQLTVRAKPGARVEVLGDWNDWKPVLASERDPGVYGVEVAMTPGTHRFLVRVNGDWTVPPGYETEPSEFGGRRAVIRVAAN